MRSFVDGKNRLLGGYKSVSALIEASPETKSKVLLKADGNALLSFSLRPLLDWEVWKQRASRSGG